MTVKIPFGIHLTLASLVFTTVLANAQNLPTQSPYASVTQRIGITDVTVSYHRPQVNDREIWGKVVPYGYTHFNSLREDRSSPWRAGANSATTIAFSHPVRIADQLILAGTYGLYMAVLENGGAEYILSQNGNSWGSFFYNPKEDVLTIQVAEKEASFTEFLTFSFEKVTSDSATLVLTWAEKAFPLLITTSTDSLVHQSLLANQHGVDAMNARWRQAAALYSMNNQVFLEDGLRWAQESVDETNWRNGSRNFINLTTYANLLLLNNKEKEAYAILEEAAPKGSAGLMQFYANQVASLGEYTSVAQWMLDKAKEQFPDQTWSILNVEANLLSSSGKFKEAQEVLKGAKEYMPPEYDKARYQERLQKLERGVSLL